MSAIAGIDLGTTYSALAALNEIGKPEIVPDFGGNRITPSVVAFEENSRVIVGLEAKHKLASDPTNVVQFVKRKMGDPSYRYLINGNSFSPVEISAFILKKLKEECLQFGEIKDVVITVPAHFDEIGRKSTMDAGKLAGLNVLGVVNEPTAAAVYYATQHRLNGKIVVYDLGGGTFDVTVLEMNGNQIDILASKGDGHLGGVDFDNQLTRHILTNFRAETGKKLFPDSFFDDPPGESCDESRIYYQIMDSVEKAKKKLSAKEQTRSNLTTHLGDDLKLFVTRADFEDMISSYLATTEMLIENALEDANLQISDIDKVVLVGGSTRIPKISSLIERVFGFPPEKAINPDEAVALGAAIMAGKRQMNQGGSGLSASMRAEIAKTSVLECANKNFGTISIGRNEARGILMERNTIIIKQGTKIPCEEIGEFATIVDNQEKVSIRVTESEVATSDPHAVKIIGTFPLDLPPNCVAGSRVGIGYGYDENQRLKVTVELPDGRIFKGDLQYDDLGNLTQSEMKPAKIRHDSFTVE